MKKKNIYLIAIVLLMMIMLLATLLNYNSLMGSNSTTNTITNQVIAENKFNQQFSSISLLRYSLGWNDSQAILSVVKGDTGNGWGSNVQGLMSAGSGLSDNIPVGIPSATYSIQFKVAQEQRFIENKASTIFFYGQGYGYSGGYGTTDAPLFDVWLNATTNHVYLTFSGTISNWYWGGNIWQFGKYEVDLGSVEQFQNYRTFTVWVDVTNLAFTKIFLDNNAIPFPTGYTVLKPNLSQMQNDILTGFKVGDTFYTPATTNLHAYFDNVKLVAGFNTPITSTASDFLSQCFFFIILGLVILIMLMTYLYVKKGKGRRG